jgi:hypothetical protein
MVAIPTVVLALAASAARRAVVLSATRTPIAAWRRFAGRFDHHMHGPRPSKFGPGGAKARPLPAFAALVAYFLPVVAVHAAGLASARS